MEPNAMNDPEVRVRASLLQAVVRELSKVRDEAMEKAMRVSNIMDGLARSPQATPEDAPQDPEVETNQE
jgi:hypothetical protein